MGKQVAMISYHTCPLASQEGKETGGMNVYVLELSKELARGGFIVDIFTRSQDTKQPYIVAVMPHLRVIHIKAGPEIYIPKKKQIPYVSEFVAHLCDFAKNEKIAYDILHCHYYLSGIAGMLIKKKLRASIPLIFTFHTLALMKNLVARDELEKEDAHRIEAESALTKQADNIIVPSENDREYLRYLYNCDLRKIAVITPGVNREIFKPIDKNLAKEKIGADSKHKIILFVGRIEPLKGIDVILYGLKIMLERNPGIQVCLWIVGGDISQKPHLWSKELQKLDALRGLLGIKTIVKFVGQRPQNELPYYYSAAELVVMPSHYESFGLSSLEAMACGTPVITSNVTGIANLIDKKHQRLITSANNPLLLASQMEHLLTNREDREHLSHVVRTRVQDLTWENVAKKIIRVYYEALC